MQYSVRASQGKPARRFRSSQLKIKCRNHNGNSGNGLPSQVANNRSWLQLGTWSKLSTVSIYL